MDKLEPIDNVLGKLIDMGRFDTHGFGYKRSEPNSPIPNDPTVQIWRAYYYRDRHSKPRVGSSVPNCYVLELHIKDKLVIKVIRLSCSNKGDRVIRKFPALIEKECREALNLLLIPYKDKVVNHVGLAVKCATCGNMLTSDELPSPWDHKRFWQLRKEHKSGCDWILSCGFRTYYGGLSRKIHINPFIGTHPSQPDPSLKGKKR